MQSQPPDKLKILDLIKEYAIAEYTKTPNPNISSLGEFHVDSGGFALLNKDALSNFKQSTDATIFRSLASFLTLTNKGIDKLAKEHPHLDPDDIIFTNLSEQHATPLVKNTATFFFHWAEPMEPFNLSINDMCEDGILHSGQFPIDPELSHAFCLSRTYTTSQIVSLSEGSSTLLSTTSTHGDGTYPVLKTNTNAFFISGNVYTPEDLHDENNTSKPYETLLLDRLNSYSKELQLSPIARIKGNQTYYVVDTYKFRENEDQLKYVLDSIQIDDGIAIPLTLDQPEYQVYQLTTFTTEVYSGKKYSMFTNLGLYIQPINNK